MQKNCFSPKTRFYRQQLESAEMDKSLIDTITKVMESVYKEFLSYFV